MPGPHMSDTPSYDELSALCAQMAAALESPVVFAIEDDESVIRLTICGVEVARACWGTQQANALVRFDTAQRLALTAYRTLSPDPVWQRVPEGCVVVPARPTPVWPQHELDALVQAYDRGRAKHGITETLMHVIVSWQKHWRARGEG